MNYDEFKNLSTNSGETALKFREMIDEFKSNSDSEFFPKQFEFLLKHLQDICQRQILLNRINDPTTTEDPEGDCTSFEELFMMDRAALDEYRTKQAEHVHEEAHQRNEVTKALVNELEEADISPTTKRRAIENLNIDKVEIARKKCEDERNKVKTKNFGTNKNIFDEEENIVDEYSIINFKQMFNPQPVKNGRHIRNKTFSLDNKVNLHGNSSPFKSKKHKIPKILAKNIVHFKYDDDTPGIKSPSPKKQDRLPDGSPKHNFSQFHNTKNSLSGPSLSFLNLKMDKTLIFEIIF